MTLFAFEHHHSENPWEEAPDWALELREMLSLIITNQETIMTAVDDLATAVAAEDTTIDSAVVLLNGIPALIASAGTDPAKLAALQADITAKTTKLAAAVVTGTPTTPPAPTPAAPAITPAAATTAATAAVAANPAH